MNKRGITAVLCGLALSAAAVPGMAQGPGPGGPPPGGRFGGPGGPGGPGGFGMGARMNWRALDSLQKLTPAQRTKLNAIRDSYRAQVQRLQGQASGPGEATPRLSALGQRTLGQIDAVLTPAQRAEYRRLREQGGPGPGFMGGPPMGGGLPPGIRLTAAQQKAYQSLQKRFDAQSVRIRQGKGTPDQKRTQMMALMRDRWNRTRALLTPAQRAQLPPQGFGGPRGFGMRFSMDPKEALDRMASELSLTPAQRKQAQPIVSKHFGAMRAMRAKMVPGSPPDPAMRDKMRAERQAMNAELSKILTPAQQQRLRSERGGMGRGPGQGMGQGPGGGPGRDRAGAGTRRPGA